MILATLHRLRIWLELHFPERHIYVRTHGEMRGVVLTPARQMAGAAVVGGLAVWTGISMVAMLLAMAADPSGLQERHARAYERLMIDSRQQMARERVPVMGSADPVDALASVIERRHEALVKLYASVTCKAASTTVTAQAAPIGGHGLATQRLRAVQADQDRLVAAVDAASQPCADRIRESIRVAGLDPKSMTPAATAPIVPSAKSGAQPFAERVHHAFIDIEAQRLLAEALSALPFAHPTDTTELSSGFGPRRDPITGETGYHPGLDFPAARMTPVFSTAPGVVSFAGVRQGYGNIVEIDHGHGLTTRFAHLAAFYVRVGDRVGLHQRLGGIGSTGHSTGPHLHYEVLVDGRPQNPERFLKAGDYVHQAG